MKKKELKVIISILLTACLFVGCAYSKNNLLDDTQSESIIQNIEMDMDANENVEEGEKDFKSSETIIQTTYKPVDYRENALIVQKSEDIELYGLLDDSSNVILVLLCQDLVQTKMRYLIS